MTRCRRTSEGRSGLPLKGEGSNSRHPFCLDNAIIQRPGMDHRATLNVRSDNIVAVEVMRSIYQGVIEIISGKEVKSGKKASDV